MIEHVRMLQDLNMANTTGHIVRILDEDGAVVQKLPKAERPLRFNRTFKVDYQMRDITVGRFIGEPSFMNMPTPVREDTLYICSGVTSSIVRRWNFIAPRANVEKPWEQNYATRSFITYGDLPR